MLPRNASSSPLSGALPTTLPCPAETRSCGDRASSAYCSLPSGYHHPGSLLRSSRRALHATACAVLCGGHQEAQHLMPLPIGPTRAHRGAENPLHRAILDTRPQQEPPGTAPHRLFHVRRTQRHTHLHSPTPVRLCAHSPLVQSYYHTVISFINFRLSC